MGLTGKVVHTALRECHYRAEQSNGGRGDGRLKKCTAGEVKFRHRVFHLPRGGLIEMHWLMRAKAKPAQLNWAESITERGLPTQTKVGMNFQSQLSCGVLVRLF